MKSSFASILLVASAILTFSCGSAESTDTGAAPVAAVSEVNTSGKGDCILSYQRKMNELLPLEVIKKHYTGEMPDAKMQYDKSAPERSASTDKYLYKWKSDRTRTMKMGNSTMEIPLQNEIGVMWVGSDLFMINKKAAPLENFKAYYRNPTQEELDQAFQVAEARLKNDPKYSKEQAETATGMAKGMTAKDKFEDVPGIGDAASFNKQENYLTVLVGTTTFQVIASVSKDKDVNLVLAKKLAKEILARCE
jgi:predicted flap endonuclease-1-like 5' DNA nuclease